MTEIKVWAKLINKYKDVELDKPQFDKVRKYHDWRNYIPNELQSAWGELSHGAKVAAYLVSKKQADGENWD